MAFLLDMVISLVPIALCAAILQYLAVGIVLILGMLLSVVCCVFSFTLRDYLFRGCSIGKRLLKLQVVDAPTQSEPTGKQLVIKGLFSALWNVDGILLVATGKSLGDRATGTVVVCRQSTFLVPVTRRRVLSVAAAAVTFTLLMFIVIVPLQNDAKKQENYRVAYSYLVHSDTFAELQVPESQITLTSVSSHTETDSEGNTSYEATFVFVIRGKRYKVVCHRENDVWYVCRECTDFQ